MSMLRQIIIYFWRNIGISVTTYAKGWRKVFKKKQ